MYGDFMQYLVFLAISTTHDCYFLDFKICCTEVSFEPWNTVLLNNAWL